MNGISSDGIKPRLELKPTNHKKHMNRRTSEIIFICLMLLLPVVQFVIFWVVPNFDSILMGFQKSGADGGNEWTLANFQKFFKYLFEGKNKKGDFNEIVYAIKNSLIYFAVNIFISTPIVIFFSYILFRRVPFSGFFKVVFYLPSIVGSTVTATLFKTLLSNGAPIFNLLYKMGFINEKMAQLGLFEYDGTAFLMVIIYSVWTCVGINMIMFYGAMKRIPQEIFESADIDGAGFFKQFFNIVVPLIWPTITTMIIFSLAGMFVSYGAVMILNPSQPKASMVGWYIVKWTKATDNHASAYYPAAVGLVFTVIGLPFVLFVRWLLNRFNSEIEY